MIASSPGGGTVRLQFAEITPSLPACLPARALSWKESEAEGKATVAAERRACTQREVRRGTEQRRGVRQVG